MATESTALQRCKRSAYSSDEMLVPLPPVMHGTSPLEACSDRMNAFLGLAAVDDW
ncbi:MAG: hypothetical protein LBU24_03505 [Methanocalculaceae archaeon]|nr:hypothetical protein [Methanocalculaceae archaeon]